MNLDKDSTIEALCPLSEDARSYKEGVEEVLQRRMQLVEIILDKLEEEGELEKALETLGRLGVKEYEITQIEATSLDDKECGVGIRLTVSKRVE